MRRWIKNFIILTSFTFSKLYRPRFTLSVLITPLQQTYYYTQDTVEVQTAFGDVLEVFDALNQSVSCGKTSTISRR